MGVLSHTSEPWPELSWSVLIPGWFSDAWIHAICSQVLYPPCWGAMVLAGLLWLWSNKGVVPHRAVAMSSSTGKMVVAAIRIFRSKGSVVWSRASSPSGAPLLAHPGDQSSSHRSLTVAPAQLAPWLSRGGGARSVGVGTDTLVLSAMGLDTRGGWGGVSRRLASDWRAQRRPTGGPIGGGGSKGPVSWGSRWNDTLPLGIQDKQLTAWIKQRKEARATHDLLWLMKERGHNLNAFHVGALWGVLAKMPKAGEKGVEKEMFQQLQALTSANLPEMRARDVADVVYSMAKLRESGRRGLDDKLARELVSRATATADDFEAQDVTSLVWGFAQMGFQPDNDLLEAMQRRATATAGDFKLQTVTSLVWGFGKMGFKPDADLLEAMQGRAEATADDIAHREVATLVWALEKVGVKSPDAVLMAALQQRATATAGDFTPTDLANLLSALAALENPQPDAEFLEAILGRATATAGDFHLKTMVRLMSAVAEMGVGPDAAFLEAMQKQVYSGPAELEAFRCKFTSIEVYLNLPLARRHFNLFYQRVGCVHAT